METFKDNGSYNKTEWELGNIITVERLNKIEDALYEINDTAIEASKIDLSSYATKEEIPVIPTNVSEFINDADYATKKDIPTIPTKISAFNNDAGYITQNHTHNNYATKGEIPMVPTHVSDFVNDAGYVTQYHTHNNYATKTELNDAIANIEIGDIDLSDYATKTYVNDAIANIDIPDANNNNYITSNNITRIEVVTEYPTTEETGVLYIKVSE